MDVLLKIAALCLVASVAAPLLRRGGDELALVFALGTVLCAGTLLTSAAGELAALGGELLSLTGLAASVFTPLLKVTAIALTVRISGAFCRDASQNALACVLETAGVVCALLAAAPLLRAVLELMEGLM